jgi:phytoene/squalene synthetase
LQLTNILRDLVEDAAMDRLYLPADRLAALGIPPDDPAAALAHPAVAALCEELAALCARRYAEADAALAACDARVMRPAIMMMQGYRAVFDALVKRGWNRLDEPAPVPALRKLWILFRYSMV